MPNCTSCGSPIPEGQGNSCSMCMGDMSHGTDGYYEDWAQQQLEQEAEQRRAEEEQMDNGN